MFVSLPGIQKYQMLKPWKGSNLGSRVLSFSRAELPWVTHEIVKLIRKRANCTQNWTGHVHTKVTTLKSANHTKQIRNAYWSYIESVIFSDTQGPDHKKKFYNFVKHKKTENIGIAPLNSKGQTHSDPVSKANILNKQFESVFSKPSPLSLKQLEKRLISKLGHPPMPPITITFQGVHELLTGPQ